MPTFSPAPLAQSPLALQYQQIRKQTELLVKPLTAEDCQLQSMPDASPTKWHLAHLTWFFETFILEIYEENFKPFNPGFRVLFNSYYNGIGDKHPRAQRGFISRPSLAEVMRYRQAIDERLQAVLSTYRDDANLSQLVTLGLQHEQQHQELILTDIKHALSLNPTATLSSSYSAYAKRWPLSSISPQPVTWHRYQGGLVEHGFDTTQDGFSFDNETPRHRVYLAQFELASRLVTNGDYLAFMADGGYQRPELWLSMGWDWVQSGQHSLPLYWRSNASTQSGYDNFTLQGTVAVDSNTPACHLNYFEADAFARWSASRWPGARLPTEYEWELAASQIKRQPSGNFVETAAFHPMPLQNAKSEHPCQMFGDVWEWTQSNYNPYPGYRPWEGLVGEYNGKFMCNQFVLRGGSCATPQSHIRASYRNFFPPDARWQFSGLRLARDVT